MIISGYSVSICPVFCNIILIFLCCGGLFSLISPNEDFLSVILVVTPGVNSSNSLPPVRVSKVCSGCEPHGRRQLFRRATSEQTYSLAYHMNRHIFWRATWADSFFGPPHCRSIHILVWLLHKIALGVWSSRTSWNI